MNSIFYLLLYQFCNILIINLSAIYECCQDSMNLTTGYDKKIFTKWQKNFHKMTKNINNYKTIKLTKNVTENCYASYN